MDSNLGSLAHKLSSNKAVAAMETKIGRDSMAAADAQSRGSLLQIDIHFRKHQKGKHRRCTTKADTHSALCSIYPKYFY